MKRDKTSRQNDARLEVRLSADELERVQLLATVHRQPVSVVVRAALDWLFMRSGLDPRFVPYTEE